MQNGKLDHVDQRSVTLGIRSSAFLDTLRSEQERFLAAVGSAAALIGREDGQLASAAAVHSRLTRQFFDAQRAMIRNRAETDAQVLEIADAADKRAAAIVRTARAGTASPEAALARLRSVQAHPSGSGLEQAERTRGQELAELGISVVRTMEDVDSFAHVIEEAFGADEVDGAVAQSQLSLLLDDWWIAERNEARAATEDAHARAAVREHIASIEAHELLEAARGSAPADRPTRSLECSAEDSVLGDEVKSALRAGDSGDLQSLLTSLADSLQPRPIPPRPTDATDGMDMSTAPIIRFEEPTPPSDGSAGSLEAFQRFWVHEPVPHTQRRRRFGRRLGRAFVPMTVTTSSVALVLAWIG